MEFPPGYFDEIRPYNEGEITPALERIIADPLFPRISRYLFPDLDPVDFTREILRCKTPRAVQENITKKAFEVIAENTTDGLSYKGFEHLSGNSAYLFMSNHRDIILDSSLLGLALFAHGLIHAEIAYGSNLVLSPVVSDIWKVNQMFTVIRDGSARERLQQSVVLSEYIRNTVTERNQSVWIAQRSGRSKDGHDKSEPALLKMLYSSNREIDLAESLGALNIAPVSISYEIEPCDFLKVREIYVSQKQPYEKQPKEDLKSMITGLMQPKGRVNLTVGKAFTTEELHQTGYSNLNEYLEWIAARIDNWIYKHYQLWPNNYIAADLLNQENKYQDHYTMEQKEKFSLYMNKGLQELEGDQQKLVQLFLQMYSNPVKNKLLSQGHTTG